MQDCNKVSVFYCGKEIIRHSENNPFLEIELGEKETKKIIKKVLPLMNVTAERGKASIKLNFYNKGYNATVEIIDNNNALKIKIKKSDNKLLIMNFPRGTKEKVSHYIGRKEYKSSEKQYLTTRISNFNSDEGGFFSLKTAKEWEIEITEKWKKMKVKGEKAKVYIVFGETKEESTQEHRKREGIEEKEKPKREIYITVKKGKAIEEIEKMEKIGLPFNGIVLKGIDRAEEGQQIGKKLKDKKLNLIIKVMPYIIQKNKGKEYDENDLVRSKSGGFYEEIIEGEKHYALNLSNKETRRKLQNKIRGLLDAGTRGLIAERGYINKNEASLPIEESFAYSEVWYILWQKLVKEVIDEYPNKILLLRNCGAKSPHYGYVMTDESKWKDIEKNRIKQRLGKMRDCGMGDVITEIGGIDNDKEKKFKNFESWLELVEEMPIIIFGAFPIKY